MINLPTDVPAFYSSEQFFLFCKEKGIPKKDVDKIFNENELDKLANALEDYFSNDISIKKTCKNMSITNAFELLLKGRRMGVGTITTRAGGIQYQKQPDGTWAEYMAGGKTKSTNEDDSGSGKAGVKTTDLQGDKKDSYMYSLDDFRLAQEPFVNTSPVQLDIGTFAVIKTMSGVYKILDPYHSIFMGKGDTLESAIKAANNKIKNNSILDMANMKLFSEESAKENQRSDIEEADASSMFSVAIEEGRMTYDDAIKILKSAGIENPRDKLLEEHNPNKPEVKTYDYGNSYKDVNVRTSSIMSRELIDKYMAVSGIPDGYKGNVFFMEYFDSVEVKLDDTYIYMKREIVTRGASNGTIINKELSIKGKYNGTDVFNNQVKNASKEGFKKIETHAYRSIGWNGYYTWLRLGYEPKSGEDDRFLPKIKKDLNIDISSITDLMYSQEGRDWWKENGESFYAEFDLSKNSSSMKNLAEYVKNKNK